MALALVAMLAAAQAAIAPAPTTVSPLVVPAPPKGAPPIDASVDVNEGMVRGQDVIIWPAAARGKGRSALVLLACDVDVHGLARGCRVAYESAPGQGFGAAALSLRPTLKLTSKQASDGPALTQMTIAVRFAAADPVTNLRRLQELTGAMPVNDISMGSNLGAHDINASNMQLTGNPLATRSVTLVDWPAWTRAPDFQAWAGAYPARGAGLEGFAVAHCKVQPAGALTHCVVAKEQPTGHDFGKAAVALAGQFIVSPQTLARAPKKEPLEVDIPVRFPPPAELKDRTVREPVWVAGADPQSLMQDFPRQVAKKGSPGALVQCDVGADGALTGCHIELTSPDGLDFDAAAVAYASRLKMNLWSAEAGPVQGGVVHVPVKLDWGVAATTAAVGNGLESR